MKIRLLSLAELGLTLLALTAGTAYASQAATNYFIPMDVIDAGGSDVSKSNNYLLSDSVGEPAVGFGASTNYILNSGYRQPSAADFLSLTCSPTATIGFVAGTGQKTGSGTCVVYTDAYGGYSLSWAVRSGSGGTNTGYLTSQYNKTIAPFDFSRSGLVGYWKMDETVAGSTVKDSSGNGYNGTPSGTAGANNLPQPDTALPGNTNFYDIRGLNFDGTDDKVSLSAMPSTTTTFTLSFWIKPNAQSTNYGTIFSQDSFIGFWYRGSAAGASAGKMSFFYSSTDHLNSTPLTDGAWQHFAAVVSAGSVTFYLNGVQDGTATSAIAFTPNNIGNDPSSELFKGTLDEMRFYNRALSAAEIKALANTPHTWSVAATANGWGSRLSSRSTDTHSKWGTDGASDKWLNIGDGSYSVITRGSATTQSGSTEILQFRAEVGSSVLQPTGTYKATATFTVVGY